MSVLRTNGPLVIMIICSWVRIDSLLQIVFDKFVRLVTGWPRPPLTYDDVNKVLLLSANELIVLDRERYHDKSQHIVEYRIS